MDKNLHDIDNIFSKAHQHYREEPSDSAWEKIRATLDKDDVEKYKKRFIGWKRIAIVLLLLLSGLVIYNIEKKSAESTSLNTKKEILPMASPVQIDAQLPEQNHPIETDLKETDVAVNANITVNDINTPDKKINKKTKTDLPKNNKQQESKKKKFSRYTQKFLTISKNQPGILQNKGKNNAVDTLQSENVTVRKISIVPVEVLHKIIKDEFVIKSPSVVMSLMPDSKARKAVLVINRKLSISAFKPYWSIVAFASNDWGQYKLENDVQNNNGNYQNEREEINNRETHKLSFSTGVFAIRQYSKKWGLKTGLIYSHTAITINPQEMYAGNTPDGSVAYKYITSSGYGFVKPKFGLPLAVGDSLQSTEAQHNLKSVSVPLMLTYRYDKKKILIIPSVGISTNYITKATVQTEVRDALNKEKVSINGLNGMKNFYFGLVADVNLQYKAGDKWAINLLPSFKYAISPITKSNVVKTYPYSIGIGAGISYEF